MTTQTLRRDHLPIIRPAWTPATIALMVAGFIIFFPLGLAMLAYIIWGERFHAWRDGTMSAREAMTTEFKGRGKRDFAHRPSHGFSASARTGNVAFDAWRDTELDRLAEERRKLDALRDEFDAYARELRRAKDQDEFDRFMRERDKARSEAKPAGPQVNED
jgi:hypothetical protein